MPKFSELHHLEGRHHLGGRPGARRGVLAGWTRIDVPGATGYLDTDYAAKGVFGIEALEKYDIVCVHVEAPDEASHEGRHDAKVEALERIDRDIVGPIREALGVLRSVADPDLARSLDLAAHPGPRSRAGGLGHGRHRACPRRGGVYDELAAKDARGPYFDQGYRLMDGSST